jgi:GNAT superfamily N-acetyltransferase
VSLRVYRLDKAQPVWELFAPHHYLTPVLTKGTRCWIGVLEDTDELVTFTSSIRMPSGTLKNAWREHRTVVLPDYQGLGIGWRMAEWLGEYHIRQGERLYSRTTHPRIGAARDASPLWRKTEKSGLQRNPKWKTGKGFNKMHGDRVRIAFSHEYMGDKSGDTERRVAPADGVVLDQSPRVTT